MIINLKFITLVISYLGILSWILTNNDLIFKAVVMCLLVAMSMDEFAKEVQGEQDGN